MKTVDWRSESWADVRARVDRMRETVWLALLAHGPCTTTELAARSGLSILAIRPRCTELEQLGFAEVGAHVPGQGHIYRALTEAEAQDHFALRSMDAHYSQPNLL